MEPPSINKENIKKRIGVIENRKKRNSSKEKKNRLKALYENQKSLVK